MKLDKFFVKINKFCLELILQPIHVYCFHHVSEVHDPLLCGIEDWIQRSKMEKRLLQMQKRYTFISLDKAIDHLKYDKIRFKKYAVLTTDDGLRSAYEMIPWILEHKLPLTMFINAKYLDGKSYKKLDAIRILKVDPNADVNEVIRRQYITKEELWSINSPLITIGLHGYEHLNATQITLDEFKQNVDKCVKVLHKHPLYRPYMAYAWGAHNAQTNEILEKLNILPVLASGLANYNFKNYIQRESFKL